VLEQVDVSGEPDDRAEDGKIDDGQDAAQGPIGVVEVAADSRGDEVAGAGASELPGGGGVFAA